MPYFGFSAPFKLSYLVPQVFRLIPDIGVLQEMQVVADDYSKGSS